MNCFSWAHFTLRMTLCLWVAAGGIGLFAEERAFLVTGTIASNGLSVDLEWFSQESPSPVTVSRRTLGQEGEATWNDLTNLADGVTTYTDTTTVSGVAYEYQVYRAYQNSDAQEAGGYWTTGIEVAADEDRGICLLIVDETYTNSLAGELERLEMDLVGDGWTVVRHDNVRHGDHTDNRAEDLRAWIQTEVAKNPATKHTLFFFGHVPFVQSGSINPDGHNLKANATDTYFADLDGTWTDTQTLTENSPGDGKFDQNYVPGDRQVEVEFGRVDLWDLSAYSRDEFTLLRDYLNKNHAYRHNNLPYDMEAYAANLAYDNSPVEEFAMHNIVGSNNVSYGTHHVQGEQKPWLWGVDFGSAFGADYANYTVKNIFAVNFGSHKDNWENSNTPNRMLLAQPWYCLANVWGVRPNWYVHHMALGKTIGYSNYRTVNNALSSGMMDYTEGDDYGNSYRNYIHINLMGDPTLRVFMIDPPSNLTATDQVASVDLAWTASPASGLLGYKVYRSADRLGPYTALNGGSPVAGTSFTDNSPIFNAWYMVRAYRLEEVAAGSFYNLSQGVFVEQAGNQIPLATSTNFSVDEDATAVINFTATDGDGDTLTFSPSKQPGNGDITWDGTNYVYVPDADFNGTDTITYTVFDGKATVEDTITVTVNPTPDGVSAPTTQHVAGIADMLVPLSLEFSDPDGDADTISIITAPTNGTLIIEGANVFYEANTGYEGEDNFVYTVSDGVNTSSSAAVIIHVSDFGEGTFSDGFTDNDASDWDFGGPDQAWNITDGVLSFTEYEDEDFLAPGVGREHWTDVDMFARVQSKNLVNSIGICVRDDGNNNVTLFISGDNGAELRRGTKNGTQYAVDASYATGGANEILLDTWYELRLKVTGTLAYAWIDGVQVFSAVDVSSAPSSGAIGFNVENNNDDHLLDDVTVVFVNASNDAPSVSISDPGEGQESSSLSLDATVTDDGNYQALTYRWSKGSGPGNALFSSATSEDTDVTVDAAGEYVFQLIVEDGELTSLARITNNFTSAHGVETDESAVDVPEGGTATFDVRLTLMPTSSIPVTVSVARVSGDTDITVQSGSSLVFTTNNWDTWQTVTLAAAQDADWQDGSATIRCTAPENSRDVVATETDDDLDPDTSIPFSENFENDGSNAGTPGDLAGQHGWSVSGGGAALVQNTEVYGGSQALSISNATASHDFEGSPGEIWISYRSKPVFSDVPTDTIAANASAAFYVNTNAKVVAYNGTTETVLAASSVSNDWNFFEVHCDYSSRVWNLSVNGTQVLTNFAFYAAPSAFTGLDFIEESSGSTAYLDDLSITDSQGDDTDSDGLPDSWEQQYYGDISVAPTNMVTNGINTVQEAYIAGLNPTNPASMFMISDLSPQTSVLQWTAASGRVYSVWWTSNLLSSFQCLESNFTGGAFTDTTHGAESEGFYKIEVEVE